MSSKEVLARGWTPPRSVVDDINPWPQSMRAAIYAARSLARFELLKWALEARRLNLRTANRKYRRQHGLPLSGVWDATKQELRRG